VTVPFWMFLPVITSAAVAVPLSATDKATIATTRAADGRRFMILLTVTSELRCPDRRSAIRVTRS
jgi:hypothetical protein